MVRRSPLFPCELLLVASLAFARRVPPSWVKALANLPVLGVPDAAAFGAGPFFRTQSGPCSRPPDHPHDRQQVLPVRPFHVVRSHPSVAQTACETVGGEGARESGRPSFGAATFGSVSSLGGRGSERAGTGGVLTAVLSSFIGPACLLTLWFSLGGPGGERMSTVHLSLSLRRRLSSSAVHNWSQTPRIRRLPRGIQFARLAVGRRPSATQRPDRLPALAIRRPNNVIWGPRIFFI